jgi:NADPH oxidase 2
MFKKRSSGLDFADRWPSDSDSFADLDIKEDNGSAHLQRNISERNRLQGLQRSPTIGSPKTASPTQRTFKEKLNIWLINEGSRRIFFGLWIFLHLLVIIFGFLYYVLSDNLEDARATFGITYGALFFCL